MFAKFTWYRKKKEATFQGRIMKGIPNDLRGKAWLYIIHPDSAGFDEGAKASKDSRKSRYARWLKKAPQTLSPPPFAVPGLAPLPEDSTPDDLSNIIVALLAVEPNKLEYSPNIGYVPSLLLGYLPVWKAFTAFLYLMTSSKHRGTNYFRDPSLSKLAKVWDQVLLKKGSAVHRKLLALGVEHKEYLTTWCQTAFLKADFQPELKLRIFDRFVKFGSPALFSFGLVIVNLISKSILDTTGKEECVRLLLDPSGTPPFQTVPPVVKKLDSFWIRKADYKKYCERAGVAFREVP